MGGEHREYLQDGVARRSRLRVAYKALARRTGGNPSGKGLLVTHSGGRQREMGHYERVNPS